MQVPLHSPWISDQNNAPGFSFSQRCPGFHPTYWIAWCRGEGRSRPWWASRQPRGSPAREGAAPARTLNPVRDPRAGASGGTDPAGPRAALARSHRLRGWGQRPPPAVAEPWHERPGPAGQPKARTDAACALTLREGAVSEVRVSLSQL